MVRELSLIIFSPLRGNLLILEIFIVNPYSNPTQTLLSPYSTPTQPLLNPYSNVFFVASLRDAEGGEARGHHMAQRCCLCGVTESACLRHESNLQAVGVMLIILRKSAGAALRRLHSGGETGIRTLGPASWSTVFETAPIDHSGISPVSFFAFLLVCLSACDGRHIVFPASCL